MRTLLQGLWAAVARWLGRCRESTSTLVALPGGALWSHTVHSSELTLTCHEGWIWLTREGDAKDHVLTAGRALRLDRPGLVVVQALRTARFSLGREPESQAPTPHRPQVVGR
jgi:hypothetical protein